MVVNAVHDHSDNALVWVRDSGTDLIWKRRSIGRNKTCLVKQDRWSVRLAHLTQDWVTGEARPLFGLGAHEESASE
jgi:hypothetical protein